MMKKVVVISGGTGGFVILSGLKKYDVDISAVVTMADSGGSSGKLRDEYGVLPPGDVRQCLVALADDDKVMRALFNYRFANGSLEGHSFGNLLLTALAKTTGSFKSAVEEASRVLAIKGRVIPVTTDDCQLVAELEDGSVIRGEHNIDEPKHDCRLSVRKVWLEPAAMANEDAVAAIKSADIIVLGPGDLFTSILPNLLVKGISAAICKSRARKVFVCNLMNVRGQTGGFSVRDYVDAVNSYLGCSLDVVIFNTQQPPKAVLERYVKEGACPVGYNAVDGKIKIIKARLLKDALFEGSSGDKLKRSLIRHDADKLAKVVVRL